MSESDGSAQPGASSSPTATEPVDTAAAQLLEDRRPVVGQLARRAVDHLELALDSHLTQLGVQLEITRTPSRVAVGVLVSVALSLLTFVAVGLGAEQRALLLSTLRGAVGREAPRGA